MNPFGFCHKWVLFKISQLMPYSCIKEKCQNVTDNLTSSLIWQFASKVIFIHKCQGHRYAWATIENDIIPGDV